MKKYVLFVAFFVALASLNASSSSFDSFFAEFPHVLELFDRKVAEVFERFPSLGIHIDLEEEGKCIVQIDLPGVKKEDVKIELRNQKILEVKATRRIQKEKTDAVATTSKTPDESALNIVEKTISLPCKIADDAPLTAVLEDGVLTISLQTEKKQAPAKRVISIT